MRAYLWASRTPSLEKKRVFFFWQVLLFFFNWPLALALQVEKRHKRSKNRGMRCNYCNCAATTATALQQPYQSAEQASLRCFETLPQSASVGTIIEP
jgi:hypothetical protein